MNPSPEHDLPDSLSPSLQLSHPSDEEQKGLWGCLVDSWDEPLMSSFYRQRLLYMTGVPLAKDGGMTMWILTENELPAGQRRILCYCESLRYRSLTSDSHGNLEENIVHGIASVFCPPAYRRRGYGTRMMRELAKALHGWQSEQVPCVGSILYSDIGRKYYTELGWSVTPSNSHYCFQPAASGWPAQARRITTADLAELCERDEQIMREILATPTSDATTRFSVIADLDHMLWHVHREEFSCEHLIGKTPHIKGAIAGPPGNRVWAIWSHCFYGYPGKEQIRNELYILRLVLEAGDDDVGRGAKSTGEEDPYSNRVDSLKAVLLAAQCEAKDWELGHVKMWLPPLSAQDMIKKSGIAYDILEREDTSLASGLWYDKSGGRASPFVWVNNERYAWC